MVKKVEVPGGGGVPHINSLLGGVKMHSGTTQSMLKIVIVSII